MAVWTPVTSAFKLIFDDEFVNLDPARWGSNWLGAPGTVTKPINSAELAAYDPVQAVPLNGNLQLSTILRSVTISGKTYSYRSGCVTSKFQFTYGYLEARIFCPGSGGKIANWPAFWSDGQNWPTDGELDVFEGLSGGASYHFHSPSGGPGGSVVGDFTGWHIYGALWEPGQVTYYYDGKQVGRIAVGITAAPMFLILNYGVGGYGGPVLVPATMLIDYVHVYSSQPNMVAVTPDPGYGGPGDDKTVVLPPVSDTPADQVLKRAVGKGLTEVTVVGELPDGKRYLDSTP